MGGGEGSVCWGRGGGGEERGTEGWLGRSDLERERERGGKGGLKNFVLQGRFSQNRIS